MHCIHAKKLIWILKFVIFVSVFLFGSQTYNRISNLITHKSVKQNTEAKKIPTGQRSREKCFARRPPQGKRDIAYITIRFSRPELFRFPTLKPLFCTEIKNAKHSRHICQEFSRRIFSHFIQILLKYKQTLMNFFLINFSQTFDFELTSFYLNLILFKPIFLYNLNIKLIYIKYTETSDQYFIKQDDYV